MDAHLSQLAGAVEGCLAMEEAAEQAQRDYTRWLDAQLARNWVLSFAGQSGDPILRTYPGLYGA